MSATINLSIPLETLVTALSGLTLAEKQQLLAILSAQIAQDQASPSQAGTVVLDIDTFTQLTGIPTRHQIQHLPDEEFRQQFQQDLADAGYDSREKIIELVQEVKRELADERDSLDSNASNLETEVA